MTPAEYIIELRHMDWTFAYEDGVLVARHGKGSSFPVCEMIAPLHRHPAAFGQFIEAALNGAADTMVRELCAAIRDGWDEQTLSQRKCGPRYDKWDVPIVSVGIADDVMEE